MDFAWGSERLCKRLSWPKQVCLRVSKEQMYGTGVATSHFWGLFLFSPFSEQQQQKKLSGQHPEFPNACLVSAHTSGKKKCHLALDGKCYREGSNWGTVGGWLVWFWIVAFDTVHKWLKQFNWVWMLLLFFKICILMQIYFYCGFISQK